MGKTKTVIVTGASQGYGATIAQAFLDRSYSGDLTQHVEEVASSRLQVSLLWMATSATQTTAERVAQAALSKFGSIDHLIKQRWYLRR